jgi:long-chain acyl-CoA synthetase
MTTYKRVFDILPQFVAIHDKKDVFASKIAGEWIKYSTHEFIDLVNQTSLGLMKIGVKKGDKIAIISPNRPEWNIMDFGIQQVGAVSVPLYPNITVEDYQYIFKDADIKLIFVADEELLSKARQAAKVSETIEEIYTFDKVLGAKNWKEILQTVDSQSFIQIDLQKKQVEADDLLTLIYTSGTTGKPKGVMLSHQNLVSNIEATTDYFPLDNTCKALSFLPQCHVYERTAIYLYLRLGVSVYYAESMDTISENLREVKPEIFTTVPRLLEKVYDKIVAKGYELTGLKRKLFLWALDLGLKYEPNKNYGWWYRKQLELARKLVFSKWKEALGGNIRMICSGAAALQPRLSRIFWAAGIPVSEGYGMTETSPVISTTRIKPLDLRIGTVGTVISGVTVKIAEDGEILVKGPNVMQGYYKNPEQTAETIDAEGWLHTGDIGEFIDGRFLKITDRKKEIFKTSGGKYVAPQMVENVLKESNFIEQICVVGEGQKFPSALIVPSFDVLKEWSKIHKIDYTNDAQMIDNQEVIKKMYEEVEKLNARFAQYERVKKIALLPKIWTIESGEITPTLKPKRKVISTKYKAEIEKLYA